MSEGIKLTAPQERILRLTAEHGMLRRNGHHWAPMVRSFHPQPVRTLFSLNLLRVVDLGPRDTIAVSEAGRAWLDSHPRASA